MKRRWRNNLYILTILFFTLGLFNIIFAWLGFACMIIPFVLLAKDGKWLTNGDAKWFFLIYFIFNLFILFMSTLMVFRGRIEPMERVRFMIAFQLPWNMPQLLNINSIPNWAVHLSFRVYSMMFTTTVIGMILGFIYRPRIWCTICPVNTISDIAIKKISLK